MRLREAVSANDLEQLKKLLSNENFDRFALLNALFSASYRNNVEAVELLIEAGADVNHEFNIGTCLMEAVTEENIEIVKILLKAGADVSIPKYGEVPHPLCEAAYTGNLEIVKLLVGAGADVNQIAQSTGDFALSSAASKGYVKIYNYLAPLTDLELVKEAAEILPLGIHDRELEENADPLVVELSDAVFKNDLSRVRAAIKKGADINGLDELGGTALGVAAIKGNLEIIKILLQAGADPNLSGDGDDSPPLQSLLREEVTRLLIEAGAEINWQDSDGITSLMIPAMNWGGLEQLKVLLEAGANPNIGDSKGKTALMYAVEYDYNLEKVKLLLQFGADVNAVDLQGNTPLKIARQQESTKIIQLLIESGAKE